MIIPQEELSRSGQVRNSAPLFSPASHFFRKFSTRGHACAISIPHARETLNAPWKPAGLYLHVLSRPVRRSQPHGALPVAAIASLDPWHIKGARKTDEFRKISTLSMIVCFLSSLEREGKLFFFFKFQWKILGRIDIVDDENDSKRLIFR